MSDLRTAAPMASENQEEAPLVETLRATAEVVGRPRSVMLNKAADEIERLVMQHAGYGQDDFYAVARAIERAHGIGG